MRFGVDTNAEDSQHGHTPLHYAIRRESLDMLKLLLQNKADPNKIDSGSNKAPLLEAVEQGNKHIVTELCERGAIVDSKSLIYAIKYTISDIDQHLHSKSSSDVLNSKDPISGKYPVQLAIESSKFRLAKDMIEDRKVKVVVKSEFQSILNTKKYSESASVALIKTLFDRTNPSINDKIFEGGQTFLHLAAKAGNSMIINFLKEHGADLSIKDEKGNTAADLATLSGKDSSIIAILASEEKVSESTKKEVIVVEKPGFI
jgi:ankyrin repeat protein